MKKAFVAILSLAALVACSQDVTVKRNDSAAIGFGNSFVENKTRVAADPSTTTNSLEEFAVWGFRDTANQLVLNNERVYKNGTEWTYDHLQYWMKDKDYFFGAVSPINPEIVKVDTQTMSKDGLGTISFTNTDGSVDLLYAEKTVYASEINPSDPDKVQLQFAHLLSRVKFSFAYNFPNELTTVAVKNIKITNSPAEGSIDVTVDRPNWSWNLPQNGSTLEVAFGDVEGGKEFAELNTYYESDNYRLLIPTDDTRNHNITFDVVVYQNHVESYTYNLATTLKDKAFAPGKSYNIVTTITPDALDMKPIEFKVVEVEDWVDGDVAAPIVLATPDVKATVAENVVTLTWDAIEGADHYTVQVDDNIAEVVKDTTYVFTGDYATEYMFSVVAVPAEGENLEASEAAVVKVTTDAKPAEALATPVVSFEVEGANVILTWNAVEGAKEYFVNLPEEGESYTTTETTFTYEGGYECTYVIEVTAIAADTEKNTNSEAAVVTVTTEAEKTIEPEELIALDADCYYIFKPATEIKGGKWYALVYDTKAATGLPGNYGYLKATTALARTEGISLPATCAFGFLTTDGGFTIQQFDGKYVYQSGTYDSFNVAATASEGHVWTVGENGITNNATSKFVQYDPAYDTYGCYATAKGNIPAYYEMVEVDSTPVIVDLSASSLSFGQDAESKVVEVAIYGSATLSASASETWVSAEVSGNTITVSVEANEGEAREATVTINYGNDSRTVDVSQAAYVAPGTTVTYTDTLTSSMFKATGTTYTEFSGVQGTNGAVYAGKSAKSQNGGYIQLRSNKSEDGIVTTASGGKVKKIVVEWDTANTSTGRTLDVYVRNTAYTKATELYNTSDTKAGSIVCGTSTELVISGDYEYVGLRSNSGAMYIKSITITYEK